MTKKAVRRTKPYPLGAHAENGGIRFAFASRKENCGIVLYDRKTGAELCRELFLPAERIGNIHTKFLKGRKASEIAYAFYEEERLVPDPNARAFAEKLPFGTRREDSALRAVIPTESYDWQEDRAPGLSMKDSLVYCLHVRGFTKHISSEVKAKGCFAGIAEKIPYFKEIGMTTLELQPAYEFTELPAGEEPRLNYWGYKRGYYYAPKAAYAYRGNGIKEFKDLVKILHAAGMELVMQFYFPVEVKGFEVIEVLRFWVSEYHVDGFHLMGAELPIEMIAADEMLSHTKLWYDYVNTDGYGRNRVEGNSGMLSLYREDYLSTMRRFLRGDEGMTEAALYQMRHIPAKLGRIHFFANHGGFTLMDMVSYEQKHNEANGEDNRDGSDYNYSSNCGEEGVTKKTRVKELRLRRIKNALCMLLFSQSTPLLFMGDEFGNSQGGNNNPYCQDSPVTWLNWKDAAKNREILDFWKQLVMLRKRYAILRPERELRMTDMNGAGYPEISYHGREPWKPETDAGIPRAGILYCGKAAECKAEFLYLAMNLNTVPGQEAKLALPKLPDGYGWEQVIATGKAELLATDDLEGKQNMSGNPGAAAGQKEMDRYGTTICSLGSGCVAVYAGNCPNAGDRS